MTARGLTARGLTARGLTARGLTARGLTARGLTARGLTARGLTARGLTARDLTARDLTARGLTARDLTARGLTARALTARGLAPKDTRALDPHFSFSRWARLMAPRGISLYVLGVCAVIRRLGRHNGYFPPAAADLRPHGSNAELPRAGLLRSTHPSRYHLRRPDEVLLAPEYVPPRRLYSATIQLDR